jgi:hypothetical protein
MRIDGADPSNMPIENGFSLAQLVPTLTVAPPYEPSDPQGCTDAIMEAVTSLPGAAATGAALGTLAAFAQNTLTEASIFKAGTAAMTELDRLAQSPKPPNAATMAELSRLEAATPFIRNATQMAINAGKFSGWLALLGLAGLLVSTPACRANTP